MKKTILKEQPEGTYGKILQANTNKDPRPVLAQIDELLERISTLDDENFLLQARCDVLEAQDRVRILREQLKFAEAELVEAKEKFDRAEMPW